MPRRSEAIRAGILGATLVILTVGLHLSPEVWRERMIFDRTALEAGQIWRLWTGHLVHFSASHLGWNLFVVCLAVGWVTVSRIGGRALLFALSPPIIGLSMWLGDPDLQRFGGLSGVATAAAMYVCLAEWSRGGKGAFGWLVGLALISLKIALEAFSGEAAFAHLGDSDARPVVLCHVAGAVYPVAQWIWMGRARDAAGSR